MMKKIVLVDFLRGFSIFTIALMHLIDGYVYGLFSKAAAFGGAGVHVFFLCSGFGLYLSYLKEPIGYSDFLKRRFGKVWVPYSIVVLLWAFWILSTTGVFSLKEVSSTTQIKKLLPKGLK